MAVFSILRGDSLAALGQGGQEPKRRHSELLLRNGERLEALSHTARHLSGAAALCDSGLDVVMQVVVLGLERLWNGEAHEVLLGGASVLPDASSHIMGQDSAGPTDADQGTH